MRDDIALAAVAANPLWYHTIELAPGAVTPGWFDLRPIVDRIPWPDVRGKRCLDVATYDGFLAFELERRGAAEVWATDVPHHEDWDWLPRDRENGLEYLRGVAGQKGRGFEIAAGVLESKVQRRFVNVYDLDPDELGSFDVVVCGSLLLHLRDPMRALAAIRGVCSGVFLSIEVFDVVSTLLHPRRASFYLNGENGQWLIPNVAGYRKMLNVAGFDVVSASRPFAEPFGASHPPVRHDLESRLAKLLCRGDGVPVRAILARPSSSG
ncbi:MAG: methyltransferase domain-containing protein [Acidimicrobiales bacterium]